MTDTNSSGKRAIINPNECTECEPCAYAEYEEEDVYVDANHGKKHGGCERVIGNLNGASSACFCFAGWLCEIPGLALAAADIFVARMAALMDADLPRRAAAVDAAWEALGTRLWLALPLYLLTAPLIELLFYFNVCRFLRVRSAEPHRTREASDSAEVVYLLLHLLKLEPPERVDDMVRGWFIDPESERTRAKLSPNLESPRGNHGCGDPHRGNVMQLIAWMVYNHDLASLSRDELAQAEIVLHAVEAARGAPYSSGTDPRLVCMRHTLEELESVWKPFCFYLGALALQRLVEMVLRCRGFEKRSIGQFEYWHLPALAGAAGGARGARGARDGMCAEDEPIVLMHGVGGLAGYLPAALVLACHYPSAPILLPCFPACAIRLPSLASQHPMATSALVVAIDAMVGAHSHPRQQRGDGTEEAAEAAEAAPSATFVAHSMGTAFLAAVLRARPGLASSALFVDPVCFLLYRRDILYNFLYRKPSFRRSWWRPSKWSPLGLHWLHTRDPCMQGCFRRDFWWSQYILQPWDIPCDAAVLLSGKDAIVPAADVFAYLKEQAAALKRTADAVCGDRELRVEMHEGCSHGWLMVVPGARRGVLELLASLRAGRQPAATSIVL